MKSIMKIGITGQNGFLGVNLRNRLLLSNKKYEIIDFENAIFLNPDLLDDWVSKCDTIVHFAALSRHQDPTVVYINNIGLIDRLIESIERTNSKPNLIFSSSKQEDLDTGYGKSKREGRDKLNNFSIKNGLNFAGLIIPNVFGPKAKPKYASVVATFCYQLINDESPIILNDVELKLIYIEDLVKEIEEVIINKINNSEYIINYRSSIKVSEILNLLNYFKLVFIIKGGKPIFRNAFEENLFVTFQSYINYKI